VCVCVWLYVVNTLLIATVIPLWQALVVGDFVSNQICVVCVWLTPLGCTHTHTGAGPSESAVAAACANAAVQAAAATVQPPLAPAPSSAWQC